MKSEYIFFAFFLAGFIAILMLDLGVLNKKNREISYGEALKWTLLWISLSLSFAVFLYFKGSVIHQPDSIADIQILIEQYGHQIVLPDNSFENALKTYQQNLALEFLTGYLIEYALSVDNIFVILLIFISLNTPKMYYHKVLFWGIVGAVLMRFLFIFLSAGLIMRFHFVLYIFGAFLVFTGVRLFLTRNKKEKINPENHPLVRWFSRNFPLLPEHQGPEFFFRKDGSLYFTQLFVAMIVIEFSDVIFAVDSVPAIFSVTRDPYIVYTSNMFAIIGLRSLFFLIANLMDRFYYLKTGLALLLLFIGLKMLFQELLKEVGFTTIHSLIIILGILLLSMLASILRKIN